jgi:hypothetical protein
VVKYLIGRNSLADDLEGEVNIESDVEGDPPEDNERTEEQVRAILITGSFSAYALFLPVFSPRGLTSFSAGNLCSSTVARMKSCSPLSNHKALTPA